jgi:3-oxoacyl-[acyl-carrier protein] reductase
MNLHNRVIVITGAGRGLGEAIALHLARLGARLALLDVDEAGLAAVSARCTAEGAESRVYHANVADEAEVVSAFQQIVADFGAVHGLVNNAGIIRDGLLVKSEDGELVSRMSLAEWQAVIDVNLTGVFLCGREAATHMIEQGVDEGVIINISSIARAGNIGQSNYAAAKAGVVAMATTWAKELAPHNIRAAAIAPGFINTDMVKSMPEKMQAKLTGMVPLQRAGEPEHIAKTVAFIIENDYISGRVFEIDGALRI